MSNIEKDIGRAGDQHLLMLCTVYPIGFIKD
jgi:hypothetical protein